MPDLTSLKLNKYQTPLTNELLMEQPEMVVQWLEDAIFKHPFIRNLISADRPYAKDAERDSYGRAILDITNPYIIEDVDYFRQAVKGFERTGKYCLEKPSTNRNSPYQRFWMREIFRCWDGMIRPEDGAWVTGLEYFFLNYYRMEINYVQKGSKKLIRKTGCPRYHERIHFRYNYKYFARELGKHSIELSCRGSGKSHCIASDLSHNIILGENWESKENVSNCLVAADESYLNTKDDGTFKKFENELTFLRENTPFPRSLLTKSSGDMSWMMGWKDKEGNPHGSKNIVFGATVAQSSDKMRGKRGFMHFEEMGNFPNLLDTYAASRRNCEDGDFAFAQMNLVGTANNKDSNFEGAKTLLYEPDENNLYSVENLYDEPSKGKSRFGLFTPAYLNRLSCDNEDGITDVVKALLQIMNARYKAKNSSKPEVLLRVIAEDPIDPAEAMITVRKAYFPTAALQEQLTYLKTNPSLLNESLKGTLVMTASGEVEFRPTNNEPLRSWNRSKVEKDGSDLKGALEIFAAPQKSERSGKIIQDRYLIGVDPIDQESAESSSLFCAIVFDRMTNSIVAEYTGRHDRVDDNYELVRLLCFYYNAKCLYENNIHGLFVYFKQFNCTYLLADAPEYLKSMEKIHYNAKGVVQKGLRATKPINDYANELISKWLTEPYDYMVENNDGELVEVKKQYLNTIMSPALLEELIGYFPEANVDRIRALGMAMILRESFKQDGRDLISVVDDTLSKGYLGDSSFFDGKSSKKRTRADMKLTLD